MSTRHVIAEGFEREGGAPARAADLGEEDDDSDALSDLSASSHKYTYDEQLDSPTVTCPPVYYCRDGHVPSSSVETVTCHPVCRWSRATVSLLPSRGHVAVGVMASDDCDYPPTQCPVLTSGMLLPGRPRVDPA
eukprot:719265-Rhodomonas_salina.1